MTGTAMTEATELHDIYKLDVIEVPTNMPVRREDSDDEVYRTAREKNEAIVTQVRECHERKQPVLVGTISIEKSETLAALFKKNKIPHHVLNARYHEQEAFIIAQAGRPGAVTIATNMAGRGTDIQLGGNYEIRKQLLKYDDVMNDQRKVVYEQRKEIMGARDVASTITDMRHEVIEGIVGRCIPDKALPEQWDVKGLHEEGLRLLGLDLPVAEWAKE